MDISYIGSLAETIAWKQAAAQAVAQHEALIEKLFPMNDRLRDLPRDGFLSAWHGSKTAEAYIVCDERLGVDEKQAWADALRGYVNNEVQFGSLEPDRSRWIKFAFREGQQDFSVEKQAASTTLRAILKGLGHAPSAGSKYIPGGPGPLVGTLTGGLAGAALGYGAGWLAERGLPPEWRRGRLSKTLAVGGGLMGALPGALMTLNNQQNGRPLNSPAMFEHDKYAASSTGFDVGLEPLPEISVDDFKNTVWYDQRVSSRLPVPVRAAASGLLESAWYARDAREPQGRGPRLITPLDIARVTAGMGTGFFSGAVVGKTLGALMGMPQSTQDRLKTTGMYAGIISNLLPLAFGAR